MVNAWSLAASVLDGTLDEDYPIMNDTKITPQESDEYDIPHSDSYYDYTRNDPNRENPFTDPKNFDLETFDVPLEQEEPEKTKTEQQETPDTPPTKEETQAEVDMRDIFTIFNIPQINQIYVIYLADIEDNSFGPTSESLDVKLFSYDEIPWEELAFPFVPKTIEHYYQCLEKKS